MIFSALRSGQQSTIYRLRLQFALELILVDQEKLNLKLRDSLKLIKNQTKISV